MVPCVGDVTCGNDCCRNNLCLNGGTCTEICEPTSVRYSCSCPELFVGKHCETKPGSCQDYKAPALTHLDCTKSLMVAIKPSQCSVTLTQSLISLGT